MFEKESEDWADKEFEKYKLEWYARKNNFQKGAEFGFQKGLKAKINTTTISDCPVKDEWQYVSEKGTPQKEGHYLVCLRNKNKDIFDCWIYYDKDVGWWSMKVRMKDIYAWKEIVPPQIKEE